jgi:hypothetical protein
MPVITSCHHVVTGSRSVPVSCHRKVPGSARHPYGGTVPEVVVLGRVAGAGEDGETFERAGCDPVRRDEVTATRRRVRVDQDLPMADACRDYVRRTL